MNLINKLLVLVLTASVVGGCASSNPKSKSPIPQDGLKMLEIYNGGPSDHVDVAPRTDERVAQLCDDLTDSAQKKRCLKRAREANLLVDVDEVIESAPIGEKQMAPRPAPLYDDYIRTSANEIKVLFPRLENPDIGIFIFPHLATANNVPVPGYSTVIPLYESVQYALPGEPRNIR